MPPCLPLLAWRCSFMKRRLPILLAFALLAAGGRAAPAQDPVLKFIPEDALAFMLVKRLADTSDKLEKIAGAVGIPGGSPLGLLKSQLGLEKGIDEKRAAAF